MVTAKEFSIGENSVSGAYIGTIVATDPDAGQTKSFTIVSGNTDNAFAIDPSSGVLTVNNTAALDFEKTRQFNLVVVVTDNGSPAKAGSASVRVSLRDVNEAPIASPQSFAVRTRASAGTLVGTVFATDSDAGQALSFSIESGNGLFNNIFRIDSRTGRITVNSSLSLLFAGQYNLKVRVRDSATPSLSTLTSIRILVNSTGTVPGGRDASPSPIVLSSDVKLYERSLAVKKGTRSVAKLFG